MVVNVFPLDRHVFVRILYALSVRLSVPIWFPSEICFLDSTEVLYVYWYYDLVWDC